MRGDRKAQPFGHPLDGRVRRHQRLSVEILFGYRTIKPANSDGTQLLRLEVSRIDANAATWLSLYELPVDDASTSVATNKSQCFFAPRVRTRCAAFCDDLYFGRLVIRPQCAVPSTDGAIAVSDCLWRVRDLDSYSAAVASCVQHD
jgi:hypothetical protein